MHGCGVEWLLLVSLTKRSFVRYTVSVVLPGAANRYAYHRANIGLVIRIYTWVAAAYQWSSQFLRPLSQLLVARSIPPTGRLALVWSGLTADNCAAPGLVK
jgi:hypothetical protein